MNELPVLLKAEPGFEPTYAKPGDAGADLRSTQDAVIAAGQRLLLKTGVSIALPAGYVGLVHPRSGLAAKHGITVLNAPGTVDAGYRGEIMVTLLNTSDEEFVVARGDRIAQLVIASYTRVSWVKQDSLDETERGRGGFGHTGKS